jgi:hypothetical protein
MRMMHALFNQLGMTQRDARLRATSLLVGRTVASANDLNANEAATLLDCLSGYAEMTSGAQELAAALDRLAAPAAA